MFELYGSPVSNCYNTVLASLRYKELDHQQHWVPASMEADFRAHSPMGKIPYLVYQGNSISETSAILEYLEESTGGPKLFPGSAIERARQRQLFKFVELYVESPARRLFPGVFWFLENDLLHINEVEPVIERGLDAIVILLGANPFLTQGPLCAADFYACFSLALASIVTEKQYGWSIASRYPMIADYLAKLDGNEWIEAITVQRDGAMQAYLDKKAAEADALTPGVK